ncbi:MAG: hypothetical protein IJ099_06525 [Alphaproteobacteria bacterium]|nr:hypothetical protein [Alphaproteobacteria bacterium]
MGFLASIPFMSLGGGVLGLTISLALAAILLALWALVLLILHPLHATIFVIAATLEYILICLCGFHLWFDIIAFFVFYISIFGLYYLCLRRYLPLPKNEAEILIKLAQLRQNDLIDEAEYKKAKKRLLKL